MCSREVEVMLEIQRFRKYSVERADNVLVPAHIVGPIRRLFLGAFLCLKYQFIEPFIEKHDTIKEISQQI